METINLHVYIDKQYTFDKLVKMSYIEADQISDEIARKNGSHYLWVKWCHAKNGVDVLYDKKKGYMKLFCHSCYIERKTAQLKEIHTDVCCVLECPTCKKHFVF